MPKALGNGRWFYFWYRATPEIVLKHLSEYSGKPLTEFENLDETALHDLAEQSGLIQNDSDFDRSPINDAVCHSSVNVVQYAMRMNNL